eukprot:27367_1
MPYSSNHKYLVYIDGVWAFTPGCLVCYEGQIFLESERSESTESYDITTVVHWTVTVWSDVQSTSPQPGAITLVNIGPPLCGINVLITNADGVSCSQEHLNGVYYYNGIQKSRALYSRSYSFEYTTLDDEKRWVFNNPNSGQWS